MRFDILTIFPHILDSYINESIMKRARERGFIDVAFYNIRDYADDKHKTTDDTPYGGGPGMILKIEPLYNCLVAIVGRRVIEGRIRRVQNSKFKVQSDSPKLKIILMSPQGKQLTQKETEDFAKLEHLVFVCGRYEGVDARVLNLIDEELSIGPYVLSGGELPAMVVVEAVTRLLPGVLGSADSLCVETYGANGSGVGMHAVEYPQYTRPEVFWPIPGVSWRVPEVLLSGDHKKIEEWRQGEMGANAILRKSEIAR